MIRYRLVCAAGHEFEGWFQSSAAYDVQSAGHLVSCPACASTSVSKAIMAPAVATHGIAVPGNSESGPAGARLPLEVSGLIRQIRAEIEKSAEYVGPRFADEARRIHHDESPARGIYGEATRHEVAELDEEGIIVFPMPRLPEDHN